MDPIIANGIQFAATIGKDQLVKLVSDKVSQRVVKEAQNRVEDEINKFIGSIKSKTKNYFAVSTLNVFALIMYYVTTNKWILYFAITASAVFLIYLVVNFIKTFIQSISYIENFERHIKELITDEFRKAKDEGWKTKLALLINSKEANDYYHLVLEEIIRSVSQWLLKHKNILYMRVLTFFLSSVCFSLSFRELF